MCQAGLNESDHAYCAAVISLLNRLTARSDDSTTTIYDGQFRSLHRSPGHLRTSKSS